MALWCAVLSIEGVYTCSLTISLTSNFIEKMSNLSDSKCLISVHIYGTVRHVEIHRLYDRFHDILSCFFCTPSLLIFTLMCLSRDTIFDCFVYDSLFKLILFSVPLSTAFLQQRIPFLPPLNVVRPYIVSSATESLTS